MNPQLARLLFPKMTHWHVKRAFEALLSYQTPISVFIATYHSTQREVLR